MDLVFVINATSDAADDAFDLMKCTLDYLLHEYKNYQVKFQIFVHGDEDTSLREISLPEGVGHLTRNTEVKIPALHDDLRIVEQAFKQSGGSNSEKVGARNCTRGLPLFHLVPFFKCWHIFRKLNSRRLYRSSVKENESCCLVFTSSTKREIRHFLAVVVQWQQRMYKELDSPAKLLFCRFRCCRCPVCLNSLIICIHRWCKVLD